jgi:hypothetical protein
MSAERDVDRIVRSWLLDGATALPDRVLDAVLNQVPATSQRRRLPVWRVDMSRLSQATIAAAAVLVVAVVGVTLLPRLAGSGNGPISVPTGAARTPLPSPTTVASAVPSPSVQANELGADHIGQGLRPGTYAVPARRFGRPFSITVPAGWKLADLDSATAAFTSSGGGNPYFGVFRISAVYRDPCHPEAGYGAQQQGLGKFLRVAEVVNAFTPLVDFDSTPPESSRVDDTLATHLTISNAIDTDAAGCTNGVMLPLFTKVNSEAESTNGGTSQELWVMPLASATVLLVGEVRPDHAAEDRAAIDALIGSLHFE